MFQTRLDVTRNKGSNEKITANNINPTVMCRMNAGRRPHVSNSMRVVLTVAPDDQCKANERYQYEQSPDTHADPTARSLGARIAERHEDVRSEKDHQAENENA